MHTAEHILNQTMVRMFGCERSLTNHIEKNKSKCDYFLPIEPTREQLREVEDMVISTMKRELDAVVRLGALVGFVLGLLNIVFK